MSEEATNSEEISSEEQASLPESAEQSETQETTVEAPEAESEEDKPRKPTAKDRIDELTRLRREAERDRDYYRELALRGQPQQQPVQQTQATESAKPDASQYEAGEFDPRYVEDLADWKANEAVKKALGEFEANNRKQESEREWQSRIAKASETMPDFEEKVIIGAQRGEWACSPEMGEALRSSGKGAELAYHLADNPAEAARIYRLSPALQLMELGKLEAKLSQPKPNTVTKAPEPAPQARGSGGKFQVNPDTNDFAAFDKAYGNGS